MKMIVLLGFALLATAFIRLPRGIEPSWLQRLGRWQKLLGVVAFCLALLIVLNPEFLALGVLGDAAFFDLLVLLLSLQLQMVLTQVWHSIHAVLARTIKWVTTPSLGLSCLLEASALLVGSGVSAFQKVVHRIAS